MRRGPFIVVFILLTLMNIDRQTALKVTVFNDVGCMVLLVGSLLAGAMIVAIKDD